MSQRKCLPARRALPSDNDALSEILSNTSLIVAKDRRRKALPEIDERDIVQAVCVRFLVRVANVGIENQNHGQALLRLTASSVVTDLLRMKQHMRDRVQLGGLTEVLAQEQFSKRALRFLGASSGDSDALSHAISRETTHQIAEALRRLADKDRRAFLRAVMKNESFAAIGVRYGMSEATARRYVAAAQQRLFVLLSELRENP